MAAVAELTLDQQKALALAKARQRAFQAPMKAPQTGSETGLGAATHEAGPRKPKSLAELTGGVVTQPLATGLGGVVGTAVGAGAGGPAAPVTAAVGGTLGTLAGTFAFRNAEDLLRQLGYIEKDPLTIGEMIKEGTQEAAIDVAVAGAGSIIRPVLASRALLGKVFGVTSEQAQGLMRAAKSAGISVGAADVGGTVPRTIVKALGVFPLTGTPAQKNLAAKQLEINATLAALVDDLAPSATLRNELGLDLAKAAGQRTKAFHRLVGRLSDNLEKQILGAENQELIPTAEARRAGGEIAEAAMKGRITLQNGEELPSAISEEASNFLITLQSLPEHLTLPQYRRLMKDLRNLLDKGEDFNLVAGMKESLEDGFNNMRLDVLSEEQARGIQSALDTFNRTYSKGMSGFETATARKFTRIDKNIFRPGPKRPVSLSDDEIADVALNVRSREAIDELEFVVGTGALKRAGRFHVESAMRLASEERKIAGQVVEVLDPFKLEKELGLGGKKSAREGLDALLAKSDVDIRKLEDLIEIMKSIETPGDPSTFIKRRVILGGAGAIAGGAGFGAAIGAGTAAGGGVGIATATAATLLARKFSDIATSPVALDNMLTALDRAASTAARQQALARVIVALSRDAQEKRGIRGTATGPKSPTGLRSPGQLSPTSSPKTESEEDTTS